MKIFRPLWNEGALLSPQQFQQQSAWEAFTNAGVLGLSSPFPWGVERVELDDELLASGRIQVRALRLWLPDGTLVDTLNSDLPPQPRELNPHELAGQDSITLLLALPLMQPGIINVQKASFVSERPLRYREEWVSLPDAFGPEEESVAVAHFNLSLRFGHESNESWQTCPVSRLVRDGQGGWRQDASFIPPMALFSASAMLHERLVLLNRQLRSRRQRLMSMRRESNERLADFAVADVSLFWLLNALNSHARVLSEYERFPARHPEQVWAELARLAGSMLTFSLEHDLDIIPGYDHAEPEHTFPRLPVLLNCRFSGPETPWTIVRGNKPFVCPENAPQASLDEWLQTENRLMAFPVLKEAFAFIRQVVINELSKADRVFPPVLPFAVAFRTGAMDSDSQALWSKWLYQRTCLQLSVSEGSAVPASLFADPLLALLTPYTAPMPGGKMGRRATALLLCCALAALAFSVANNQRLIQQIGGDLARWRAIPMGRTAPKAQSLSVLKRDALLLERWQRQGEPQRYGLGLYTGQRLWLALQQAIDGYVPPSAPTSPAPQTIRLDALSLFDTGQWRLKSGSTKVLVNALMGIKARPGWLIVVAGHTDDVGDERANQQLSLKRAEAVRDWMRDTGDVPESCFAVQGYGESRPAVPNTTAEGRALNRRVEISLVPQADACRLPDIPLPPSQDESGTQP